jgi:hypothetical protein
MVIESEATMLGTSTSRNFFLVMPARRHARPIARISNAAADRQTNGDEVRFARPKDARSVVSPKSSALVAPAFYRALKLRGPSVCAIPKRIRVSTCRDEEGAAGMRVGFRSTPRCSGRCAEAGDRCPDPQYVQHRARPLRERRRGLQ